MAIAETIKSALGIGTKAEAVSEAKTETKAEPTGLDKFAFLGENTLKADPDAVKPLALQRSSEAMTPEAVQALTEGLDFTSAISSETLSALKEGNVEALLTAFNDMSKKAYLTALQHSGALADNVLDTRLSGLAKDLPSNISSILTRNQLKATPAFDNPVVRQAMNDTASRILKVHPDASPAEVAEQTKDYFTELAKALNPDANFDGKARKAVIPSTDWFEYALNDPAS